MDPSPKPRRVSLWTGAAMGALWTGALVALSALLHAWMDVPNAAFVYFEAVSRWLPGAVITAGIEGMLRVVHLLNPASTAAAAKVAEQVLAVALTLVSGAASGLILAAVARRVRRPRPEILGIAVGALAAGVVWFLPASVTRASGGGLVVLDLLLIAWGALVGASVAAAAHPARGTREPARPTEGPARRRALAVLASSAIGVIALASGALSMWQRRARRGGARRETEPSTPEPGDQRIQAVPGTRKEVTSNRDFYRVDIDLTPPGIDGMTWRLQVGGLVDHPLALSIAELRAHPAVTQILTLECISNPVGGDLISTAPWTGCRLGDLLREAGIRSGARAVGFRAADGFHESTDLSRAAAPSTLLVYAMNGVPLPTEHGFPLRLYMPDRHGMKLPKWIERIDVLEHEPPGYWVERGWSKTAIPHTTSVIDVARIEPVRRGQQLTAGGVAYAGARGIRAVELQIDRGPWLPAKLRSPPRGENAWIQWRYDGPIARGRHTLRVRATDGTGAVQTAEVRPPHPSGATGLHQVTVGA